MMIMKNKNIKFSNLAREELSKGVTILSNAVTSTLGPNGRNVIIEQELGNPVSTKDGVTVAKAIKLKDTVQNLGVQLVRQASIKTADAAGDGTTTSTLLASKLFNNGLSLLENHNSVEIKRGIDKATSNVISFLREKSIDITEEEQIKQVATISGNNDPEVGALIATAMENVGQDGVITIEESKTGETYLETVEGMQFDRGYKSPYFVTDNSTMTGVLNEPLILLSDKRITAAKELLPILEACSSQNKSLLIIADDIDGEALSTLVVNKMRGIISVAAVKAPQFGDRKKAMLEDIAILTGGQVVSQEKGMRLEKFDPSWLGKARKVTIGKDTTTIVDGKGEESAIENRVNQIKELIDNSVSPYEIETLQDRLGRLVGGVGIVHVGGMTEVEMKEKKDRVEDALHATRAALEEGILPGGGLALLAASNFLSSKNSVEFTHKDQELGYNLVLEAIKAPFRTILDNAYGIPSKIEEIENSIISNNTEEDSFWLGFNPRTEQYCNFLNEGIIDPTKVARLALENAASVAGTMLITECVISNVEEDNNNEQDDMEGMFG